MKKILLALVVTLLMSGCVRGWHESLELQKIEAIQPDQRTDAQNLELCQILGDCSLVMFNEKNKADAAMDTRRVEDNRALIESRREPNRLARLEERKWKESHPRRRVRIYNPNQVCFKPHQSGIHTITWTKTRWEFCN